MELPDLDLDNIQMTSPKTSSSGVMMCKVSYLGHNKVTISLRAHILGSSPTGKIMLVQPKSITREHNKACIKKMVKLERALLVKARNNAGDWFGSGIDLDKFDSNFVTSVVVGEDGEQCFRLHLQKGSEEAKKGKNNGTVYMLSLQLDGVRFKQNAFSLLWRLGSCTPCPVLAENHEDEEDDDVEIDILPEELQLDLADKVKFHMEQLAPYKEKWDVLQEIQGELADARGVKELLAVSERLHHFFL